MSNISATVLQQNQGIFSIRIISNIIIEVSTACPDEKKELSIMVTLSPSPPSPHFSGFDDIGDNFIESLTKIMKL